MTDGPVETIVHQVHRLSVDVGVSFDDFRARCYAVELLSLPCTSRIPTQVPTTDLLSIIWPEAGGRPELEPQWINALRRGAFLNQYVPGDVFAELDDRRSERHRTRSARGIGQVTGLVCRCAIGDEQQIERRPATVARQLSEKRSRIRPCVEHRGRHHQVVRRAARQDECDGGDDDG